MNNHEKYVSMIGTLVIIGVIILLCSYFYVINIACPKEQTFCGLMTIVIDINTAIFFYFLGLVSQSRNTEHEYINEFNYIMSKLRKNEQECYARFKKNKKDYEGMTNKEWILSSDTKIFIAINDWSSRVYYDLMRGRIDGKYLCNKTYSQLSSLVGCYLSTVNSMNIRSSAHHFPQGSYYNFYNPTKLMYKLKQFKQ